MSGLSLGETLCENFISEDIVTNKNESWNFLQFFFSSVRNSGFTQLHISFHRYLKNYFSNYQFLG